jgi:phosphoglycerate kinase
MKYIDEVKLTHKTILVRVDFNVALNPNHTISDDARIKQSLPTLEYLLKLHNKLILISHLGEPEKRDANFSLLKIAKRLQEYLPHNKILFVEDFLHDASHLQNQKPSEIALLENIRFYPGETKNDPELAKQLAGLGEVYVNDAFAVSHRAHASVVGLPKLLPAYGGLLMKKEVTVLEQLMKHPKKPFVAIVGGKKISTKIQFINKLASVADAMLLGGALANVFLAAQGHNIGEHLKIADEDIKQAKHILALAEKQKTEIVLPDDVVVAKDLESTESDVRKVDEVKPGDEVLDIGPETQAKFGALINRANTIMWNGPVGYMENPVFKRGTDFLYYAITQNFHAVSVVGGGDTLAAINKKEYLDKITHISTGGGAMLEFIEKGHLPGIDALK